MQEKTLKYIQKKFFTAKIKAAVLLKIGLCKFTCVRFICTLRSTSCQNTSDWPLLKTIKCDVVMWYHIFHVLDIAEEYEVQNIP